MRFNLENNITINLQYHEDMKQNKYINKVKQTIMYGMKCHSCYHTSIELDNEKCTSYQQNTRHITTDTQQNIVVAVFTKTARHLVYKCRTSSDSSPMTEWETELNEYQIDPITKAAIRDKYNFRPFKEAPESKIHPSNTVSLDSIDLNKYDEGSEARRKLADTLEDSLTKCGFFKVTNFGVPEEKLKELLAISQSTFEQTDEVKKRFIAGDHDLPEESDRYLGVIRGTGYKPIGHWKYGNDNNTPDNIDMFNFRHFNQYSTFFNRTEYPEFVKYNLDDIAYYFSYLHFEVLRKICHLIDIILETPEGSTYKNFAVVKDDIVHSSNGYSRLLFYHPVNEKYKKQTNSTWMRGHTDGGALTLILSQTILSLQIRDYETNEWKYVQHTPGALIVNIGDMFQQITGGYFRSSIHRVVTPPEDQKSYNRNTAIYFSNFISQIYLDPEQLASPKLKRLGYKRLGEKITVREWDDEKGQFFNQSSAADTEVKSYGRTTVGWTADAPIPTIKT